MARRIHDRGAESRGQQDNEQWHLLILDELIGRSGVTESRVEYFWIPQGTAVVDYGTYDSLADMFCQIGHDERVHRQESEQHMRNARFR
jgi:ubiquinol oxidase